jgi:hypothetical protein
MRRTLELERLAQVARQQVGLTTNTAAADTLRELAQQFEDEARERRLILSIAPAPDEQNPLWEGGRVK